MFTSSSLVYGCTECTCGSAGHQQTNTGRQIFECLVLKHLISVVVNQSFRAPDAQRRTTVGVLHPAEGDGSVFVALAEAQQEGAGGFFLQQRLRAVPAHEAHDGTETNMTCGLICCWRRVSHDNYCEFYSGLAGHVCWDDSYPSLQRSTRCFLIRSRIPSIQVQALSFCPHRKRKHAETVVSHDETHMNKFKTDKLRKRQYNKNLPWTLTLENLFQWTRSSGSSVKKPSYIMQFSVESVSITGAELLLQSGRSDQTLTHDFFSYHWQLVFVESTLAYSQKLPADSRRHLLPGERRRVQKQRQVLQNKYRLLFQFVDLTFTGIWLRLPFWYHHTPSESYTFGKKVPEGRCKVANEWAVTPSSHLMLGTDRAGGTGQEATAHSSNKSAAS